MGAQMTKNNPGYLYILTNPSIHGQVKIGRTERHPEDRRKEISAATGVATPFDLAYYKFFNDCHLAESTLHKRLEQEGHRVSNNREFFTVDKDKAMALLDNLSTELDDTQKVDTNALIKDGLKWLHGNEGTLKNEKRALEHFEQAAALGSAVGAYLSGKTSEKIALTIKRKADKASWQQRALNHYQTAIGKKYLKAYARASWLFRKFDQHNEANQMWDSFLEKAAEKEKLDDESSKWIIKWADNQASKKKELPDSPVWKKHGKHLISLCDKNTAPHGLAARAIKKKLGGGGLSFTVVIIFMLLLLASALYFISR